jgi:trimethylamine--corrinoid protein Co-methyltransferase
MESIRPIIQVLNQEKIHHIHQYTLNILANPGVRIDSPEIVSLLEKRIGKSAISGDCVRLPADLVEWAIHTAPPVVEIFDRRGQPAFRLGDDRTRFGIGVTTLYYQDPITDALSPFTRANMQTMTRLGDSLPLYDVISTLGIEQDISPAVSDLYGTLDMIANTTKPLVILVSDENVFPAVIEMLETLHGDLSTRPFVIPYFNPVSPLAINKGTLDKMQLAIQHGLPFIFSNYSMAGASTPITAGGTLCVLLAELLAGLTISQVIKEHTPVILGILPAFFDMKTMTNFYDPQSLVLNLACGEMMAHYHLPHCGTSGSGAGWGPDILACETYWMNQLSSCLGKVGLCPFVGDTLGSKAFSPVNVVYVHEIIDQCLRFAAGFQLDETTVNLEEISKIGPGGSFLSAETTLKSFRKAYYPSPIFPRWSLEKWQDQGQPKAINVLREYTQNLLRSLKIPADQADLMTRGERWISTYTK